MFRKWLVAVLMIAAIATALAAYHAYVLSLSKEHFKRLLDAPTVEEKRIHYDAIRRFFDPWNPYRERAERWLEEEGHEWEFLREERDERRSTR
jgi:hypothetical protein